MTNSLIKRSVAVAGVTLFLSGLLSGAASAAEAVTGSTDALPQLRCNGKADPPERDGDNIRGIAETSCRREANVVEVRVRLQKYDRRDDKWKDVANGFDRNRNARRAEAGAEVRCERGRYRTVAEHVARDGRERYRDSSESEPVRIRRCR
jgi:hypothetical protein